jgi:hypothetical protein
MSARTFCYADPPYLGVAQRYYGHLHAQASEYDKPEAHWALMDRMEREFPDGWAMSCSVPSLRELLFAAPDGVRVAAWVKPFSGLRPFVRARFAWEPVIYRSSLAYDAGPQFCDVLSCDGNRKASGEAGFIGRKPEPFVRWVLDLLGWRPGDHVVDLFQGSGDVARVLAKVEACADLRQRGYTLQLFGEAA